MVSSEHKQNTVNLIFDLDGCLINSTEVQKNAFYGSYKEVVGDSNCPPFEEYLKHTGDSISNVMKKMNLPVEMVEVYRRISRESIEKVIVNWDCIDLIRNMRKQGSKIAICTGKDRIRTIEILQRNNVLELFDVIVCSDDVLIPKPAPLSIDKAVQEMCVLKETCILIGDGLNDVLCAQSAGITSILATWYGKAHISIKADYVASSITELQSIITKVKRSLLV